MNKQCISPEEQCFSLMNSLEKHLLILKKTFFHLEKKHIKVFFQTEKRFLRFLKKRFFNQRTLGKTFFHDERTEKDEHCSSTMNTVRPLDEQTMYLPRTVYYRYIDEHLKNVFLGWVRLGVRLGLVRLG